jgi:hypothetical protein
MLAGGFAFNHPLGARSLLHHDWPFRGGFVLTVFLVPRWRSLVRHRLPLTAGKTGPRIRRIRFVTVRKDDVRSEITHAVLAIRCLLAWLKTFLSFRLIRVQLDASVARPIFDP